MMIDECVTFMIAATQTTTMTVSNMLYYITRYHTTLRQGLHQELQRELSLVTYTHLSPKDWSHLLLLNSADLNFNLLTNTMHETLRIEPP